MRTIIAPTDFFSISRNAVYYAADMAAAVNAELLVFHVIQIPVTVAEIPLTEFEYNQSMNEAREQLAALKTELLARSENKITISTKIVVGSVEHELEEICNAKKPFAVIMGTERASEAERFFIGSNTLTAVKKLHYTIFVIPPHASFTQIKSIAWATDLKDIYNVPLQTLRELVHVFKASLDIVHVCKTQSDALKDTVAITLLQKHLEEFHPKFEYTINKDTEAGISEYAKQHNDDVILVIPRKHGFFEAIFHGSQSKRITLNPAIPVIAVGQ